MLVTVFTPTFNRAHTLERLFHSLLMQTRRDFEWVVVDDGSTDATEDIVRAMIPQASFPIIFIRQPNGGKHRAVNRGLHVARGVLFFIVDSDDDLTQDALEQIENSWNTAGSDVRCAGLCFRKMDRETGRVIGPPLPHLTMDSHHIEMAAKYHIHGDKAEIFRSSLLRECPFPEIPGETFVPESFLWDIVSAKDFVRFIDRGIYNCEYLDDGYTRNFKKNLRQNPLGFLLRYSTVLCDRRRTTLSRLSSLIRVAQCLFFLRRKLSESG